LVVLRDALQVAAIAIDPNRATCVEGSLPEVDNQLTEEHSVATEARERCPNG
jgi:hypothetical protein